MATRSFQTLLSAAMVALVVTTSVALFAIGIHFGRRGVRPLVSNIGEQTLARVDLRVQSLLNQGVTLNQQTARLIAPPTNTRNGYARLGTFFAKSLEVQEGVNLIGFGIEQTGEYVKAERMRDRSIRIREYRRDDTGRMRMSDWKWNGTDGELLGERESDGFDPRQRPYYQLAKARRASTWTESYDFWADPERGSVFGLTYATPSFDAGGRLIGVLNADFELQSLCGFLAELEQELPGYPFVLEERADGTFRLVAHPHPEVAMKPGLNRPVQRIEELSDPVVAAYLESLRASAATNKTEEFGRRFFASKAPYFGSFQRLTGPSRPPWVLGLVVPAQAVVGSVWRNAAWGALASLLCMAGAVVFSVWFAQRIARPLRDLGDEAHAIGELKFETTHFQRSEVREVRRLQQSMADMKASLRSFRKYVPADVVHQLIATQTEARLGGREVNLTVFFSDIVGFTAAAEALTPQELVEHLGDYLAAVSEIIQSHRGTVDKFIGDGVMAFWGAPQENPAHAVDACAAAWQIQRRLDALAGNWQRADRPALHTRIGLHTGPVVVGNIGSESRMNYTVIGDTVNLASRMEGLNGNFGTQVLLSETTRIAAGEAIIARPVSRMIVKGRTRGVLVFELLGLADDVPTGSRELARQTMTAWAAFEAGRIGEARGLYEAIIRAIPGDAVARFQLEKCFPANGVSG